jgi:hypothetical protein
MPGNLLYNIGHRSGRIGLLHQRDKDIDCFPRHFPIYVEAFE